MSNIENAMFMQVKSRPYGSIISLVLLCCFFLFVIGAYIAGYDGLALRVLSYKPLLWLLIFCVMMLNLHVEGLGRTVKILSLCFLSLPMFYVFEYYYECPLVVKTDKLTVTSIDVRHEFLNPAYEILTPRGTVIVHDDSFFIGDNFTLQKRTSLDRVATQYFACKKGRCAKAQLGTLRT